MTSFLKAPFTRRTWAEFGYALLALPVGILGLVYVVVGLSLGAGLAVTLVGVPLLAGVVIGARGLGAMARGLARGLLGVTVAPPRPVRRQPGVQGFLRTGFGDVAGWRAVAYLLLAAPLGVLAFALAITFWAFGLAALAGMILLVLAPWVVRAAVAPFRSLVPGLLGPVKGAERLRALERTRAQAVDNEAATLRRIERDLHDGAQAQLVALAMNLGMAREKLDAGTDPQARELIDNAHRNAKQALTELRDLARGIHPPVLDSGLEAALATLASRSAVPVRVLVRLPVRPSAAIETITYFCAAELLANVGKHSRARHAVLEVTGDDHGLQLRVADDGIGGGTTDGGGLRGLADRVRTVDGRIEVTSPAGGPTVVIVSLPTGADPCVS